MAVEDDLALAIQNDVRRFVGEYINQYTVTGTGDGSVTVRVRGADRTIPKLKGVQITPGDEALVIKLGNGMVAIGAITTIGVAE